MVNSASTGWMSCGAVFARFKGCERGKRREEQNGREGGWVLGGRVGR